MGPQGKHEPGRGQGAGTQQRFFVGRDKELALLADLREEAAAGRSRLVAICGEAGIGKTALARKAGEEATGEGFRVLWGRFHEGQYAPPYSAWKEIARALLEAVPGEEVRSGLEPFAAALAEIVPEFRREFPSLRELPEATPAQARLRLMDAFLGLLAAMAQRQPTFLVLDNLHCADTPSLELLEAAGQEMAGWKLLAAVLYREPALPPSAPMWTALGAVAELECFSRICLQGLDANGTAEYLRQTIRANPPPALVRAVHQRTEGNLLFIAEVVTLLANEGLLEQASQAAPTSWVAHIPEKIRLAILGWLHRLTSGCRDLLSAAAVVGRQFDASLVAELVPDAPRKWGALLEEALTGGWVEEAVANRFRFRHALIRESVLSQVAPAGKADLSLRIADALERRYGAEAELHAGELADYFDAAGPVAAPRALRCHATAGQRALRLCSYDDAFEHFRLALAAGEGLQTDWERAELLAGLAMAQHGRAEFRDSVASHARVLELLEGCGQTERACQILEQPYLLTWRGFGAAPLLRRAIEAAGAGSHWLEKLGFHYGLALHFERGGAKEAEEVFRRALEYARRRGDRVKQAFTLISWSQVLLDERKFGRAAALAEQGLPLAEEEGELWAQATGITQLINSLLGLGRVRQAGRAAAELSRLAERMRSHFWQHMAGFQTCLVRRQLAGLPAAREAYRKLDTGWLARHLARRGLFLRFLLELEQGNPPAARELLPALSDPSPCAPADALHWFCQTSLLIPYLAWLTGEMLPLDPAEELARKALASAVLNRAEKSIVEAGRGFQAVIRGDAPSAAQRYRELVRYRGQVISPGLGLPADHLLALLAGVQADLDCAESHFQAAAALCREAGMALPLAYVCFDFAELLRKGLRDRERARALHREAQEIAEGSGMKALLLRLSLQGRQLGAEPKGAHGCPDSLTVREAEVLRLLAEGLSNEQIGSRLFISTHTVANHVRAILAKTGAANRTEAAVQAVRQGQVRPAESSS